MIAAAFMLGAASALIVREAFGWLRERAAYRRRIRPRLWS